MWVARGLTSAVWIAWCWIAALPTLVRLAWRGYREVRRLHQGPAWWSGINPEHRHDAYVLFDERRARQKGYAGHPADEMGKLSDALGFWISQAHANAVQECWGFWIAYDDLPDLPDIFREGTVWIPKEPDPHWYGIEEVEEE